MAGSQMQQFEQVVAALMSYDNNERKQAEAVFEQTKQDPTQFFMLLTQLLLESKHAQAREMAAVLLRQHMNTRMDGMWARTSEQARVFVKNSLLAMLQNEQNRKIRKAAVNCAVMLASALINNQQNQWPELLNAIAEAAKVAHPLHQESVLTLLARLSEHAESIISGALGQFSGVISQGLTSDSKHVRLAAVDAMASMIVALNERDRQSFVGSIPALFQSVATAAQAGRDDEVCDLLQLLLVIVNEEPTFLRPQINSITDLMCGVVKMGNQLEFSARRMAMEFLLELANKGKGMIRRNAHFVSNVIPLAFRFLLELEHTDDWNTGSDEDDLEQEAFIMGMEAIDRLAMDLGGKKFGAVAVPLVQQFLNNPEWLHRHAALMAVSEMADGCKRELQGPTLDEFTQLLCDKAQNDPNVRVRWAAVNALANFATDLAPNFQKTYHQQVMPVLIKCMASDHPRIARLAAHCIVDFCAGLIEVDENEDEDAPNIMASYVGPGLQTSLKLLNSIDIKGQEAALTVVSSLANVSSDTFKAYYDSFMPGVMQILRNAQGQESLRELRGKAMECVGNIAKAVGKEAFRPQANDVMELLVSTQRGGMAPDDPQYHYLVQACARICQCMQDDFVPYLDHVIPSLLKTANQQDCVVIEEASAPDRFSKNELYQSTVHDLRGQGPMRVSINSSALEEKAAACNMLFQYVYELRDGFGQYIKPTFEVLLPMVSYKWNPTVRIAAVQAMPFLLQAARISLKKQNQSRAPVTAMFNTMFRPFFECIAMEFELTNMSGVLEAFSECIGELEEPLPPDTMSKVCQLLRSLVQESEDRRKEYVEATQQPDFDEEEAFHTEAKIEIEDEFLSTAHSVINAMAKVSKDGFFPVFESELYQLFWPMLSPQAATGQTVAAMCVFDDVIGKCGPQAQKYIDQFLPLLFQYCQHHDASVRQCAVFGVGCCAENLGPKFGPAVEKSVNTLLQVINHPGAKEEDNEPVTDNAISSLGKIAEFCLAGHQQQQAQLFGMWVNMMPLNGDWEEAKAVHSQLMKLVKSNHPGVMGANNSNMPQIIKLMAMLVTDENTADEDTRADMLTALKQLAGSQPDALQQVLQQLPEKARVAALACIMNK